MLCLYRVFLWRRAHGFIHLHVVRYLGGKLIGDEEFCMQTDAHMDFEDFWDQQLLNMWGKCTKLEPS